MNHVTGIVLGCMWAAVAVIGYTNPAAGVLAALIAGGVTVKVVIWSD